MLSVPTLTSVILALNFAVVYTVSIQLAVIHVVVPRALKLPTTELTVWTKMSVRLEIRVQIMLLVRIQLDPMNVCATLDIKDNSVQMLMSVPELQKIATTMLIVLIH